MKSTNLILATLLAARLDTALGQCTGFKPDRSRTRKYSNDDIFEVLMEPKGKYSDDDTPSPWISDDVNNVRSFVTKSRQQVFRKGTQNCILERVRLEEKVNGVKVYGAESVVTLKDCKNDDNYDEDVVDLRGTTYSVLNVVEGFTPTYTAQQATHGILAHTGGTDVFDVGYLSKIVYPTPMKDYLAYIGEVIVDSTAYEVIIDAHNLVVLSMCEEISSYASKRQVRRVDDKEESNFQGLRAESNERKLIGCERCEDNSFSDQGGVSWTGNFAVCPTQALYLSNDKRVDCRYGFNGNTPLPGPYAKSSLYYAGTLDCNSTTTCNFLPFRDCQDASYDVHIAALTTLTVLQERVGIMGGLHSDARTPVVLTAAAHYGSEYCGAFFRASSNTIFFGDCTCVRYNPFVSLDIVAHEITHGVNYYTSALYHDFQAGGLAEGFADIMGAVVEFAVDDSVDSPDFKVGENVVEDEEYVIRYMEDPEKDGSSIDSICDYNDNLEAHVLSGVLNKAFVKSVRFCALNGCSSTRNCVLLMGPLFMYANVNRLTKMSAFTDAAAATCDIIPEFIETRTPSTSCTEEEIQLFVQKGWDAVQITVNDNCVASFEDCDVIAEATELQPMVSNFFAGVSKGVGNAWGVITEIFGRYSKDDDLILDPKGRK